MFECYPRGNGEDSPYFLPEISVSLSLPSGEVSKRCPQVVIMRHFSHFKIGNWGFDFLFSNSFPSNYLSNNNQTSGTPVPSALSNAIGPSAMASTGSLVIPSPANLNDLKESSGSRKARVLYDYDAANSTELSLLADEVSESQTDTPGLRLGQSWK